MENNTAEIKEVCQFFESLAMVHGDITVGHELEDDHSVIVLAYETERIDLAEKRFSENVLIFKLDEDDESAEGAYRLLSSVMQVFSRYRDFRTEKPYLLQRHMHEEIQKLNYIFTDKDFEIWYRREFFRCFRKEISTSYGNIEIEYSTMTDAFEIDILFDSDGCEKTDLRFIEGLVFRVDLNDYLSGKEVFKMFRKIVQLIESNLSLKDGFIIQKQIFKGLNQLGYDLNDGGSKEYMLEKIAEEES